MNEFSENNIILIAAILAVFYIGCLVKYWIDKRAAKKRRGIHEYD